MSAYGPAGVDRNTNVAAWCGAHVRVGLLASVSACVDVDDEVARAEFSPGPLFSAVLCLGGMPTARVVAAHSHP